MSESKRVVFDLDDTLIKTDLFSNVTTLRPGTEDLLKQLRGMGLDLILWTTAGQGWIDRVFSQFPDILENFSQVITAEDADMLLGPLKDQADKFGQDDPRNWCLKSLGKYHGNGGKYPPAVKARYLVDNADAAAYTARVMETFEHISPNSLESDKSPDEWAKRVARALLGK